MKQPEIRIVSPEEEINFSEIIPQKIEKEKETMNNINNNNNNKILDEENMIDPNLEFSFGKDLKKHIETNRLKTDYYLEKKQKELLSDNLSNYQLTDSIPNFIENDANNKKMKLIKEKFISNFKSKHRNESLEKAFTLFQKFHNNLNSKMNISNLSFSQKIEKPFRFLTSQSTNSLSIIDKNRKKNNNINKTTLNTIKSNEDFFKYKIRKISKITKEKQEEKENTNKNNETNYEKKSYDKKIFNLKNNKILN